MKTTSSMLIALCFIRLPIFANTVVPFHDEFDDGAYDDGQPVEWRLAIGGAGSGGTREIADGSFEISGTGYTAQWVDGSNANNDTTVRASVSLDTGLWGFAIRGRRGGGFYWAGIRSSGNLFVGHTKSSQNTFLGSTSTHLSPTDEFVSLQMSVQDIEDAVQIDVYAWEDGEKIPDDPQFSVIDDVNPLFEGSIGMFINQGSPGTAFVDFYQAFRLLGDFDGDGALGGNDVDLLSTAIRDQNNLAYDVDGDRLVDTDDRTVWIKELRNTYFGDSNLDGEFNSSDLVSVFHAGQYEDKASMNSTWATGDWNGDGDFTSSDFVLAFENGGYELGPKTPVVSVPEPCSCWLVGMLLLVRFPRQRSR